MNNTISLDMIPDKHILIVDDTEDIRELLVTIFSGEAKVSTAVDGAEALDMVSKNYYDLIISDVEMPRLNGIDFYSHAVKRDKNIKKKFMFFTGSIDKQMRDFIHQQKIYYLPKPSPINKIKLKVNVILNKN